MKKILAIIGSAQENSSNFKLVQFLAQHFADAVAIEIFDDLKSLPHFDAVQTLSKPPQPVQEVRKKIEDADAVLVSSPEYIFSIPSGLKNLMEWCVATTIFSDKPAAIIVASADGRKSFEDIKLIMKTLGASFSDKTCLLINGIKGKISDTGQIEPATQEALIQVVYHLRELLLSCNVKREK